MSFSVSQSSQTAVEEFTKSKHKVMPTAIGSCTLMSSRRRENLVPEVTTWPRASGPQLLYRCLKICLGLQNSS